MNVIWRSAILYWTGKRRNFWQRLLRIISDTRHRPRSKSGLRRRPVFRRKTRAVATAPFFTHLAGPPESDMRQRTLPSDRLGTGRRLLRRTGRIRRLGFLAVDFQGGGQSRAIILSGHSLSHSQRLEAHRRPQTQTRNNRLAEPPSCGIFRTSALRTAALSTYMVETAESADEMGS